MSNYTLLELSGALVDHPVDVNAVRLFVEEYGGTDLTIKFNTTSNDAVPFRQTQGMDEKIEKVFISSSGGDVKILFMSGSVRKEGFSGTITTIGTLTNITNVEKVTTSDYDQISVDNTATQIVAANTDRKSVTVQNLGAEELYIGTDNSVTTANGIKLLENGSYTFENFTGTIFGIRPAATQNAAFIQEGA